MHHGPEPAPNAGPGKFLAFNVSESADKKVVSLNARHSEKLPTAYSANGSLVAYKTECDDRFAPHLRHCRSAADRLEADLGGNDLNVCFGPYFGDLGR